MSASALYRETLEFRIRFITQGFSGMYRWNKEAWMNIMIFKDWLISFTFGMGGKFARQQQPDKKAWLLLDNSSTHVAWEGVIVKAWNANQLTAKGFEL